MISNQILQNTIEGLKAITRIDLCVMDIEGKVLASTFSMLRIMKSLCWNLSIHRQTVRFCKGFSFSRFLMSISWSLLFWQEETVMMSI